MNDKNNYFTTWIDPQRLDVSWLPYYFDPIYQTFDKKVEAHPELFSNLADLVKISSPQLLNKDQQLSYRYRVVRKYGELSFHKNENISFNAPVTILPRESVILSKIMPQKVNSIYWNEEYYPGGGIADFNYIVLESRGVNPIAWLHNELQKEYCQLQIKRSTVGSTMPQISFHDLLKIKIRLLKKDEIIKQNRVVKNNAQRQSAIGQAYSLVTEGQKAVKPFFLTGATFQERLSQFEENLQKQPTIDTGRIFFVEASTKNPKEDLFIVRYISEEKNILENFFAPQHDPDLDSKWREWYWDKKANKHFFIFNSMTAPDALPAYLLIRMILKNYNEDEAKLLKGSLLPSFKWFQSIVEYFQDHNEIVWDDAGKDVVEKWVSLHINAGYSDYIYYNLDANEDLSRLYNETEFPNFLIKWFRVIFSPVLALKVFRDSEIVGAYLLFSSDRFNNPYENRAWLEGIGQSLCQILELPSEMIDDAAKRESLRRMSDIMHRLNGPTGRIVSALEDINKYLDLNIEIANSLVPDEATVQKRLSMKRKEKSDYTLRARMNNIDSAINEIRDLSYKIKRLNMIKANPSRENLNIVDLVKEQNQKVEQLNHDLTIKTSIDESSIVVNVNRDVIADAISEVLHNSGRELKTMEVSDPLIIIYVISDKVKAYIKITDNALPVNKQLIKRPFEEGASTYARIGKGSGFGLAIVKEAFSSHGGSCILFENKNENGDRTPGITFEASLPIVKQL
jgi:signal transduction histidine kinase